MEVLLKLIPWPLPWAGTPLRGQVAQHHTGFCATAPRSCATHAYDALLLYAHSKSWKISCLFSLPSLHAQPLNSHLSACCCVWNFYWCNVYFDRDCEGPRVTEILIPHWIFHLLLGQSFPWNNSQVEKMLRKLLLQNSVQAPMSWRIEIQRSNRQTVWHSFIFSQHHYDL